MLILGEWERNFVLIGHDADEGERGVIGIRDNNRELVKPRLGEKLGKSKPSEVRSNNTRRE